MNTEMLNSPPPNLPTPDYLSIRQLADILRVDHMTVRARLMRAKRKERYGKIVGEATHGKRWLFKKEILDDPAFTSPPRRYRNNPARVVIPVNPMTSKEELLSERASLIMRLQNIDSLLQSYEKKDQSNLAA